MATYTFDVSTPESSADPKQGDDRIREVKNAIHERENKDHYWEKSGDTADADDVGLHRKATLKVLAADPAAKADAIIVYGKDVDSKTEAFSIDEDSNVVQLTSKGAIAEPVGVVKMFAGAAASVPTGWLLCNGAAVSRTTYANLFGVTSTRYGVGNGSTTFNLPNLVAKFPRGIADNPGTGAGADTHSHANTLAAPAHTHTVPATNNGWGRIDGSIYAGRLVTAGPNDQGYATNNLATSGASATALTGSIADGANVPAYTTMLFIIKI